MVPFSNATCGSRAQPIRSGFREIGPCLLFSNAFAGSIRRNRRSRPRIGSFLWLPILCRPFLILSHVKQQGFDLGIRNALGKFSGCSRDLLRREIGHRQPRRRLHNGRSLIIHRTMPLRWATLRFMAGSILPIEPARLLVVVALQIKQGKRPPPLPQGRSRKI